MLSNSSKTELLIYIVGIPKGVGNPDGNSDELSFITLTSKIFDESLLTLSIRSSSIPITEDDNTLGSSLTRFKNWFNSSSDNPNLL